MVGERSSAYQFTRSAFGAPLFPWRKQRSALEKGLTQLGGRVRIRVQLCTAPFTAAPCCPSPRRPPGWGSHRLSLRMTWTSTGCHYFSTKRQLGPLFGRKIRFSPFLGHGSRIWDAQVWTFSPFGSKTGHKARSLFSWGERGLCTS